MIDEASEAERARPRQIVTVRMRSRSEAVRTEKKFERFRGVAV